MPFCYIALNTMIIIQTAFILSDDRLRGIGERGKEKEIKGMVIRRNEVVS